MPHPDARTWNPPVADELYVDSLDSRDYMFCEHHNGEDDDSTFLSVLWDELEARRYIYDELTGHVGYWSRTEGLVIDSYYNGWNHSIQRGLESWNPKAFDSEDEDKEPDLFDENEDEDGVTQVPSL